MFFWCRIDFKIVNVFMLFGFCYLVLLYVGNDMWYLDFVGLWWISIIELENKLYFISVWCLYIILKVVYDYIKCYF